MRPVIHLKMNPESLVKTSTWYSKHSVCRDLSIYEKPKFALWKFDFIINKHFYRWIQCVSTICSWWHRLCYGLITVNLSVTLPLFTSFIMKPGWYVTSAQGFITTTMTVKATISIITDDKIGKHGFLRDLSWY